MTILVARADAPEIGIRALKAAPVIIATDGRDQSDPAIVAGRIFAGEENSALRVVSVVEPMPIMIPDGTIPNFLEVADQRRAQQQQIVQGQMRRLWLDEAPESAEVYEGDPARCIADVAHSSSASLVVVGLGRHRVMDRLFGGETALRLVRLSGVPVLAASPGLTHAPHRIVVAVDFSETSLRAARLAIQLAAPEANVYLVHVAPRDATGYYWSGTAPSYRDDAGAALQKVRDQLIVPDDISVQRIVLHGDPATELLAFALSVDADLIATGSHGHGFVTRLLIGSVTTRILRCAECSVLSVPYRAAMTRVRTTVDPPVVNMLERAGWAVELDAFSRRNAGRRGVLEVDDPEIGAQAQENDYPFLGGTFDRNDERVELMFGDARAGGRHLTRSIGGVSEIDVLRDERGRDVALRIAHGPGQTLLTLTG